MYVIFPADEIVYLSYGRLIYVPSTSEPDNRLRTPPIRTSFEESQLHYPTTSESDPSRRESDELLKSTKSKEAPEEDLYCIGSRSIDLETRESLEKIRIDGTTFEARGSSEQRSLKHTTKEPDTLVKRGLKPESSFFLKRYTNRSLRTNNTNQSPNIVSNINTPQSPDGLNRLSAFNKPAQIDSSVPEYSQAVHRFGTTSRPVKAATQKDIDSWGSKSSRLNETKITTEIELKTDSPESSGVIKSKQTSKSLKAREIANLENRTLERGSNCNSNKSSKSSKHSSSSTKSVVTGRTRLSTESGQISVRVRTVSDSVSTPPVEPKKKLTSNSFRSFLRPSFVNKDKTPDPPVRPERKKDKKTSQASDNSDRKLSYSDYLPLNRERVPRSDIINTRIDRIEEVREKPSVKREKSPGLKFFRAQSSSPKTFGRERTAFDFDGLFKQEPPSPGRLSVNSASLKIPPTKSSSVGINFGSDSNLAGRQSEKSPSKKKQFFRSVRGAGTSKRVAASRNDESTNMAGNESPLKDLIHPSYNEHLKSHNAVSFKLIRTVSDFTQQLGQMYEHHAEELQMLVANFRKRNGELRKERPACPSSLFHTWETLLQEIEIDSQALGDIASILGRQVSRPLLERSFHRKIQSRKVFSHRESYETIIAKTEEKLAKCRQEYKSAYMCYLSTPSTETLSAYFNTHNAYIQQLHATNGMMEEFQKNTLPSLLQELEEIYVDLCATVTEAVLQGAEVVSNRSMEQCRRYDSLISQCKAVSGISDLTHLSRSLPAPPGRGPIIKRIFVPPQPPPPPTDAVDGEIQDLQLTDNLPPPLRDELVIDKLSAVQLKPSHDVLKKEAQDLEAQIRQIQDSVDTLLRIQQKSVEASLYNKANELQEDISMKRFDLRVAQIHMSAINSQKELFSNKLEGDMVSRERKMSSASQASMKNKWLKAFKSLKTPPPEAEPKKNGAAATKELLKGDPDAHNFQEYTYKKITPCDICSQVLRGHTRQGLKCRICKMNIHMDCVEKSSKCQTKARLLRRQKSTSEIETRVPEMNPDEERVAEVFSMPTINRRLSMRNNNQQYPNLNNAVVLEPTEVDQIYQVLKQATEISNNKPRVNVEITAPMDKTANVSNPGSSGSSGHSLNRRVTPLQPSRASGSSLAVINPAPSSTSSDYKQGPSTPNSAPIVAESTSMRRRLFAGMKSLTGFGSRSRQGSPGHRSISLPEKRNSQDGSGNRPFGQPLFLGPQLENGNGLNTPPSPSSSTPKGKISPVAKKRTKPKK